MASFWEIQVVVVGVGKLEEKLTDVLQVLDTVDGPRQILVFSPGTASEQHAQQSGPDGDLGNLFATHEMILLVLFRNLDQSPDQPNRTVQVA